MGGHGDEQERARALSAVDRAPWGMIAPRPMESHGSAFVRDAEGNGGAAPARPETRLPPLAGPVLVQPLLRQLRRFGERVLGGLLVPQELGLRLAQHLLYRRAGR